MRRSAIGTRRRNADRARHRFRVGAVFIGALFLTGCVERTLLFTSDPVGAHLTVNGKEVGLTPVTIPFVHNQRFGYRVEKDGYRSVAGDVTTPSTWDSVPGIDFFAENVYAGHIRRQTVHHVTLERLPASRTRAELEAILHAGAAMGVRAATETGGPGVPPPDRPEHAAALASPKAASPQSASPKAPQAAAPASR